MTIKVAINGYRPHRPQRPARPLRRRQEARHPDRRDQRPRQRADQRAPDPSTTPRTASSRARCAVDGDSMVVNGDRIKVRRRAQPGRSCRGASSASTWCWSAPASSPPRRRPARTSQAGAKKVIISAPGGKDVDAHRRLRRQPQRAEGVRHRDLQRLVHHQLPGAAGQGAARPHRRGLRPDDHHPLVHQRPGADRRLSTRTCAARARRRRT